MSRRNNKAATQAETADLVSALSEAASSSSSSAPIHATRGASAALLAKEITHDSQPVVTSSTGLEFRSFSPMASQSVMRSCNCPWHDDICDKALRCGRLDVLLWAVSNNG